MRAGKACVDRLPPAHTGCRSARREGLGDASPRGTAWSEASGAGQASPMAQGHRWSTIAGEGGVIPGILKRCIVPTGEPWNTATVPHGSVGGRGKRRVSDLARGLPNLLRHMIGVILLRRSTVYARILLANLLQSSRSTFSWGSFPSLFAFKAGMLDTQISAPGGWPTVSAR